MPDAPIGARGAPPTGKLHPGTRSRSTIASQPGPIPRTAVQSPADDRVPDPALFHLLSPKWITARARARGGERGRVARFTVLGALTLGFWAGIFVLLFRLLTYFKGIQEIGPLLAGKLLGLVLVSFFSILLLSNVITALSSFFLARDLDLLVSAPVDWLKLYGAKLLETSLHSSWMVALMAVPIVAAYGVVYDGGPLYPLVALATFVPFFAIPSVIGSALTNPAMINLGIFVSLLIPSDGIWKAGAWHRAPHPTHRG